METNNCNDMDYFIYTICKNAYNCEEYIETHLNITYDILHRPKRKMRQNLLKK